MPARIARRIRPDRVQTNAERQQRGYWRRKLANATGEHVGDLDVKKWLIGIVQGERQRGEGMPPGYDQRLRAADVLLRYFSAPVQDETGCARCAASAAVQAARG